MDLNDKEKLNLVFKSRVNASYFNHMGNNKATAQSKIQIQQIQEDVSLDTFRIMPKYNAPNKQKFTVFERKGQFYLEQKPIFSCIRMRNIHEGILVNTVLKVMCHDKMLYCFDFNTVDATIHIKGDYFKMKVQGCDKDFYFEVTGTNNNNQGVREWAEQLTNVIQISEGKTHVITQLARNLPDFYKYECISNEQFQKNANSCDIILFRSQHSAARLQRAFTDSDYDHVGIMLRNRKNQLSILQSTSNQGVGLTPWKHMVKYQWYKSTKKIAWRRLNIELTAIQVNIVEQFVIRNLGKGFEINFQKLLQFKSKLQRTKQQQQNKTYFCSELVARLYKELGLLSADVSCTKYYPVDFSNRNPLKLIKPGVHLQCEKIITFFDCNKTTL